MRAVVFDDYGGPLALRELPKRTAVVARIPWHRRAARMASSFWAAAAMVVSIAAN
jgi:hypothetical protein